MVQFTRNLWLLLLSSSHLALASPTNSRGRDGCRFPLVSLPKPTGLLKQTTELFKPILDLAADTWCSTTSRRPLHSAASETCDATPAWPGFERIEYVVSFGDSYTTTEFRWRELPVPSLPELPLGNPAQPRPPSHTSSNGPNWIEFLTTEYNRSQLLTYNIAKGGATVVLPPNQIDTQYGLPGQVEDIFIPGYASGAASSAPPPRPDWNARNTLFAIWLGINDVNGSYMRGRGVTGSLNREIIRLYAAELEKLFEVGLRNVVLLNVPPLERAPWITVQGEQAIALMAEDLRDFNGLIQQMAVAFKAKHREEVNVWVYDSYRDFTTAIEQPTHFEQTKNVKNVTDWCESYFPPTPEKDTFYKECGVPVNQYLWYNSLHPGYAMHEVVADQVVKLLEAGPNIC